MNQLEEAKKKDVKKKEEKKEITLLDAKRAMNTSIAIARIKMTYAETRQAIMNMDEAALSANVLQSLQVWFGLVCVVLSCHVLCRQTVVAVVVVVRVSGGDGDVGGGWMALFLVLILVLGLEWRTRWFWQSSQNGVRNTASRKPTWCYIYIHGLGLGI